MRPCFLFVDIDGVLNSMRSLTAFGAFSELDPVAVGLVSRLCRDLRKHEWSPQIVISSTWRSGKTLDHFRARFPDWTVVGMTPQLGVARGREVLAWLRQNGHANAPYIAFDDDGGFAPDQLLIQTSVEDGLQVEHIERAFAHFTGKAMDVPRLYGRGAATTLLGKGRG